LAMTSEAKRALSTTIRSLRARLIERDLPSATESAYRLSVRARDAGLDEAALARRTRLEAWIAEQLRAQRVGKPNDTGARTAEDFRGEAEKQAAYTLLNRLVILRLMEAPGPNGAPLRAPAVETGGWESRAYKDFRQLAPALVRGDETEGYAFLLQLVFEELATELPGLYGPAGVADLIPIPAATLRHVVEALDTPALQSCWTDDMTLGWVYQYWNDPEREALDDKLQAGGKLQPHEVASKTQMFTERYMVDWLLQNSLSPMWLAMCRKHGWASAVEAIEADGQSTLQRLEARRADWRAKREAGEVSLIELMPLHTHAERRWAYYVPQPIPHDAVERAPHSVRDLKLLDPAVGSGHFLVVAMDLLMAFYREEARHRGAAGLPEWTDRAIVERILSHNLHGIDLDPRAVQIAAAALWLKARHIAPDARPERLNLVASNLRLASLPDDDPALVELRHEVERETGIPGNLTNTIVHALRGADYLGSLLKVDRAVDEAIEAYERTVEARVPPQQIGMFSAPVPQQQQIAFEAAAVRRSLLERLEGFLARHTSGDDLGLRLRGEQLAAGVRFVRMVREGAYDLVVANPPYQGTSKVADSAYIENKYPLGKADLYAAFLLRGLEMAHAGGVSSMLTMRNWMFVYDFRRLRSHLLDTYTLCAVGDFETGAFEDVNGARVTVAVSIFEKVRGCPKPTIALRLTLSDTGGDGSARTGRKRAATVCHFGLREFDPAALKLVPEWPLVYWWSKEDLRFYAKYPKVGDVASVRQGLATGNNARYLRRPWEVASSLSPSIASSTKANWVPYIKGAAGEKWIEGLSDLLLWDFRGLQKRVAYDSLGTMAGNGTPSAKFYFKKGVAFSPIGTNFTARAHRYPSIIGHTASSVFGVPNSSLTCVLNTRRAGSIAQALNPGVHFEVGDVKRLPLFAVDAADLVFAAIELAFSVHESRREPSVEFIRPGSSAWRHAQEWAQAAIDRPDGEPLPAYVPEYDPEPPIDHLSYAVGVALGRFGANGEGILDPTKDDLSHTLPAGILFLDGTLEVDDNRDSLGHSAAAALHEAWAKHAAAVGTHREGLRAWLALDFFKDVHKGMYENRPIHWPLSSKQKIFVAWVNIHRFSEQTLRILLADHLHPTLNRLEGELTDLRKARDSADRKAARVAEKQYDKVLKARDELQAFIDDVEQCADRGAPLTGATCPPREQDARYAPDLDDGVMINSAALWPLLDPQWKDPKKWWKELSEAKGKKDYDWSHLAMRYWPARVDQKCQDDPSLGVAHGCFWRYHSARAWSWELRLQDEISLDFRIEEAPYRPGGRELQDAGDGPHRDAWLRDHVHEALAAVEVEAVRRMGRGKGKKHVPEMRILEAGLWSVIPDEVWAMELRLAEKARADFRLLAPDEAEARAVFEAANPDEVRWRAELLKQLALSPDLLDEADDDDEAAPDEEAFDDATGDEENAP
jgi:hypothetical protein